MRQYRMYIPLCLAATLLVGCTPQALDSQDGDDAISTVASAAASAGQTQEPSEPTTSQSNTRIFSGSLSGSLDYRLFDLGAGRPGDSWQVVADGAIASPFVVVLLDQDKDLLMRTYMSYSGELRHIIRANTDCVYLGVMTPISGSGGDFRLKTVFNSGQSVPGTASQKVYLNFGAGRNVQVHTRAPISFAPFDAAVIGDEYAGHTAEMIDVIVREMRADYNGYNLAIYSSLDGDPPEGAYSTIHFGGDEPGLLGLADNVDNYNQSKTQKACVYIENFAPYWTMQLTPEEMAVMIANVASHELGHLLGLYHTKDPDDIMDTTGTAWQLAENQNFKRGLLEDSVFSVGYEHCPRLLSQTLGQTKAADTSRSLARRNPELYHALRQIVNEELHCGCGTCMALDHE